MSATAASTAESGWLARVGASAGRRGRRRSASLTLAAAGLLLLLGISILMRVSHIGHPTTPNLAEALRAPSVSHWFGTDSLGRDVFGRTMYAAFTDVEIAAICAGVPAVVGLLAGVLAGYFGGWGDRLVTRIVDFVLAFPLMVLVMCVVAIVGPGLGGVYLGLATTGLPGYIRLARGQTLVVREQQFMLCAQTLGFSRRRILANHLLPHVLRPLIVYAVFQLTGNILLLTALSYLGLGIQPPGAEWGAIMADGQSYFLQAWWIVVLPGVVVVLTGIAICILGEGLAERLRLRGASQ